MRPLILVALGLAVWLSASLATARTIRLAPPPMENQETMILQFRPLAAYLARQLEREVVLTFFDSWTEILAQFQRDQLDLALLGAVPYVTLRQTTPQARPLVRFRQANGQATCTCALVTFADNGFDPSLAIRTGTIALTQPLATCGILAAGGWMGQSGRDGQGVEYRYLGTSDAVALGVVRGTFDAGCLGTAVARRYRHLGLEVVMQTPPLPGPALVGNTHTLNPAVIDGIRRRLIALAPGGPEGAILALWGARIRHGAVAADDADYRSVRELLGQAATTPEGQLP